ncbi:MAG: amidase [Anaerolineae bacterium]
MMLANFSTESLARTASALRSGSWNLLEYLDWLEARFEEWEPAVLAFVPEEGRFERLRRQAASLLSAYPEPENRPLLFGVPVGVKDIFHAKGFETRAGSHLPPVVLQGPEADSVTALRQAGALVLGKTVTTEFAYFAPGPTRNPHHPEHTPGGSSSGSAAAVGAGLCTLAFGTQTIGSVNRPASFCGVVGYKPSYDRISRAGVIPLSVSLDHVGLFAPSVSGVDMVAGLLCRYWQLAVMEKRPVLGVPDGPYLARASEEGLAHFEITCQHLAAAGFEVKRVSAMPDFDAIYARHNLIVAAEAAQAHADWFSTYADLYHPKTAELIRRGQQVEAEALTAALAGRVNLRHELLALMDKHELDLWISPAAPGPAPKGLDSTGDPVMNLPWTHSGLPTLSLPSGVNEAGLPLGLQLTGRWYGDEIVLAWAAEIEPVIRPELM